MASSSSSRKRVLSRAGLRFKLFEPDIAEERFILPGRPEKSCLLIAKQKALKARSIYKDAIIIASDQLALLNGELFGKAHSCEKAIENLRQLQGKTHTLLNGLCMLWRDKEFCRLTKSRMSMRALSLRQIENYVLREKPLKSAGSYHIEAQGIQLFEKIETEDFNAIEGLALIQILNRLIHWGFPLLSNS